MPRPRALLLSLVWPFARVFAPPAHPVHHPKADYLGLGLAAFSSWVGVPGAGEAALVTAAIVAAHHRLDIGTVVTVAFAGAVLGGTVGWYAGRKGGSALFLRRGPFLHARLRAHTAGGRFYDRFGPVAVFFTPSWLAGVHDMRARRYLVFNALSALVWALVIGLGAFFLGSGVGDAVTDLGAVGATLAGLGLLAVVLAGVVRRRRRA
jgi:membrane protein DedA with SNARE-associated domain